MYLESFLISSLTFLLILFTTIYFIFKYKYNHWARENVPYVQPTFPFGNTKDMVLMRKVIGEAFSEVYTQLKLQKQPFGGMYMVYHPMLFIIDPELVKNILTKDFEHFHDRGMFFDDEVDPLSGHLVFLNGIKWKNMRTKLSPTFTSGKMKMMFHTMLECTEHLKEILDDHIKEQQPIDSRELFARLSTDIVGSCAFGINCNSLKNPDNEFREYGKKVFQFGLRESVLNLLATNCPWILKFFKIPQIDPDITRFFMGVLKDTVDQREKNNIKRKDFLELLIKLKNNQSILDEEEETTTSSKQTNFSFNELAAQAFVFFFAGFETTASTLNFCLFELSKNIQVQDNLRKEVVKVLESYDGKITYEALMDMKYMDKVFNEVLRKYPPVSVMARECTKDYKIPDHDYTIKQGTGVIIAQYSYHHDPDIYPDPEKFDPERFNEEQKQSRHPYSYLPFGEGPRICIGMRFALLEMKIVLTALLKDYKFTLHPKTITPVTFNPKTVFLAPKHTFWLKVGKIN